MSYLFSSQTINLKLAYEASKENQYQVGRIKMNLATAGKITEYINYSVLKCPALRHFIAQVQSQIGDI